MDVGKMGFTAKVLIGMIILMIVVNVLAIVGQRSHTLYRRSFMGFKTNADSLVGVLRTELELDRIMKAFESSLQGRHEQIDQALKAAQDGFARRFHSNEFKAPAGRTLPLSAFLKALCRSTKHF